MRRVIANKLAIVGCAFVVLVTACSSTGGHSGTESNASSGGGSSSPTSSGPTSSGNQIVIGFANNEAGPVSIPEFRYGAIAAVNYVNATGGVQGKQLRLRTCSDDGSPEGSIQCANTFIANHAVVYFAGEDTGADSAIPILAGANVPYVTEFPWGSVQDKSPDAFALGTGDAAFNIAPLHALKSTGVKSVAWLYLDVPIEKQITPVVQGIAATLGIKVIPISVSATSPDWTSAVAAAQAAGAQSMWAKLTESGCTNMVKAARSAGFKGLIAVGSCSNYIEALGNQAADTLTVWPYWSPQLSPSAPAAVQTQLSDYEKYMNAAGYGKYVNGYATSSFSSVVELAEAMRGIQGPVTGSSLLAALKVAHLPGFLSAPANCADHPVKSEPVACNANMLLLKVVASKTGPIRQLVQNGYDDTAAGS